MARTMTAPDVAAYLAAQAETASEMLALHRVAGGQTCSCGRPSPCPVASAITSRRDDCLVKIALLEQTVILPTIQRDQGEPSHSRRGRRVLALLRLRKLRRISTT